MALSARDEAAMDQLAQPNQNESLSVDARQAFSPLSLSQVLPLPGQILGILASQSASIYVSGQLWRGYPDQELDLRVGVAFSRQERARTQNLESLTWGPEFRGRLQTMYFRKHFGRQLGKQMVT